MLFILQHVEKANVLQKEHLSVFEDDSSILLCNIHLEINE